MCVCQCALLCLCVLLRGLRAYEVMDMLIFEYDDDTAIALITCPFEPGGCRSGPVASSGGGGNVPSGSIRSSA